MKSLITVAVAALSLVAFTATAEAKTPTPKHGPRVEAPPLVHGAKGAPRAAISTLTGVVTASGQRQAGASVTLQYWNGSSFVSLAGRYSTNSRGVYTINVYSGWYYRVQAAKMIGRCPGSYTQWLGQSNWTGTYAGRTYNLPVAIQYRGGIAC